MTGSVAFVLRSALALKSDPCRCTWSDQRAEKNSRRVLWIVHINHLTSSDLMYAGPLCEFLGSRVNSSGCYARIGSVGARNFCGRGHAVGLLCMPVCLVANHVIRTECVVIGRSQGKLGRFTAHDPVATEQSQFRRNEVG